MAKQGDPVKTSLPVFLSGLQQTNPPLSGVTLVVPATDILLTTVQLPKLNRQRLIQALPFALEDGLIDDVSQLHFATGPRLADGHWPVAVVAKTKMQAWMDSAREAGLSLAAIIPDVCTLPVAENRWTIDVTDTDCVARTGIFSGFSCHRNNLATFVEAALAEPRPAPSLIHLRFFSALAELNLPLPQDIQTETTQHSPTERPLMAQQVITAAPVINLLQNEWQGDAFSPGQSQMLLWKAAAGLLILSTVIFFSTHIAALFTLERENTQLKSAISRIYFRHFPHASSVVAPKTRFSEKLRGINGQNNSHLFSALLTMAAPSLAAQRDIRLEWMEYHSHQLQIGLTASSFDSLDTLIKALTAASLTVHQQTAATDSDTIKATLMIRSSV